MLVKIILLVTMMLSAVFPLNTQAQSDATAKRPAYIYDSASLTASVALTASTNQRFLAFMAPEQADWVGVATTDSVFIGYALRSFFDVSVEPLLAYTDWDGAIRVTTDPKSGAHVNYDLVKFTAVESAPLYRKRKTSSDARFRMTEGETYLAFKGDDDWALVVSPDSIFMGFAALRSLPSDIPVELPEYEEFIDAWATSVYTNRWTMTRHRNITSFEKNMFGNIDRDVTRVRPSGSVYYKLSSYSTQDFDQAFDRLRNYEDFIFTSVDTGVPVYITKLKTKGEDIEVTFESESGDIMVVELENEQSWPLHPSQIRSMMNRAFGEESTSNNTIELGMSVEEVIKVLGEPEARVNLGNRVVLTIAGLKLTFLDGKLSGVE